MVVAHASYNPCSWQAEAGGQLCVFSTQFSTEDMWPSDDNFWKSILFFCYGFQALNLRSWYTVRTFGPLSLKKRSSSSL